MRWAAFVVGAVMAGTVMFAAAAAAAQQTAPERPAAGAAAPPAGPAPSGPPRQATMKELMLDLIYPTSDVLFYVAREEPKTDAEWLRIQLYGLALAESANVLMAPPRARDQGQWMQDARLLLDAGLSAYRAAQRRDYKALVDLNADLYEACQACHVNYRPGYRRRP